MTKLLMTLTAAGLCVSGPEARGADGPAGDSGKKVESMPVDGSAFTREIDQLVTDELKRLGQEFFGDDLPSTFIFPIEMHKPNGVDLLPRPLGTNHLKAGILEVIVRSIGLHTGR